MGVQLNEDKIYPVQITISPAQVSANTTAEQTFTLTGLRTTDIIETVVKPTHQNGLGITGFRVSAADTLAIGFVNATAGAITPTASQTYTLVIRRPEKVYTSIPA